MRTSLGHYVSIHYIYSMGEIIVILIIVVGPFVATWIISKFLIMIYTSYKLLIRLIKVVIANKHGLLGKLIK